MIGFNNKGFAGKTKEELIDEEDALEILRKEQLYINDFSKWAQEQSDQINKITLRYNKLSDRIHLLINNYNSIISFSFVLYSIFDFIIGYYAKVFIDSLMPDGIISFTGKAIRHFILGSIA